MKLINDLCSTGFWVSVLLPTFFRFHFGSDVKEFDSICFYFILEFWEETWRRSQQGGNVP